MGLGHCRVVRYIWVNVFAFLCGFNIGRGNLLGFAMFLGGIVCLTVCVNRMLNRLESSNQNGGR